GEHGAHARVQHGVKAPAREDPVVGAEHRAEVLHQLEALAEPEPAGAEEVLGGLGGVDDHPVHGHQEVQGDDHQDRGDQDGGGGLPARVAGPGAGLGGGAPGGGPSAPGGRVGIGAGGVVGGV